MMGYKYDAILIIPLSVNFLGLLLRIIPVGNKIFGCYQIHVLHRLGSPRADSEMFTVQKVYKG